MCRSPQRLPAVARHSASRLAAVAGPRRIAVVASASGNGKTTFGHELARRLGVPFHELDALHHGPRWAEATPEQLRARVAPLVAAESWVIDGGYRNKIGDLVLDRAELVVWLDLPVWVWLPRLLRRSIRRVMTRELLWNDNVETASGSLGLITFALRAHRRRRRNYPSELARFPVVRVRTPRGVDILLEILTSPTPGASRPWPPKGSERSDEVEHGGERLRRR